MTATLGFFGAAETVTGSRHLLSVNGKHILIDCGLFQGPRELRELNWMEPPIPLDDLDAIVLTHAHADHIGWLPRLAAKGYKGPVYATRATIELCKISLPDSGRLMEEEARFFNRHQLSRHTPALPLYTESDAYAAIKLLKPVGYHSDFSLPGGVTLRFYCAGHILGSAFARLEIPGIGILLMSGDLGRYDTPIIKDPEVMEHADYLVIESTYGDRFHSQEDPSPKLEEVINKAMAQGGVVVVPSFAIGRTQELLYFIHQLHDAKRIPRIPIFVDSPMATSTTQVFIQSHEEHDEDMRQELSVHHQPLQPESVTFVRDREQSKAVNSQSGPMMIIAGSGMANGGRVVHHLKRRLQDPSTIVLFTGYQAQGTLGRELIDGAEMVTIHREEIAVRAEVDMIGSLSAHADQTEMLRWLSGFKTPPKKTFIVHGEPEPQRVLKGKIEEQFGWECVIPQQAQTFDLG